MRQAGISDDNGVRILVRGVKSLNFPMRGCWHLSWMCTPYMSMRQEGWGELSFIVFRVGRLSGCHQSCLETPHLRVLCRSGFSLGWLGETRGLDPG